MSPPAIESSALRLTGRDVLAVLHRVTTQKLLDLAPGESRTTLFCDFRGRLLHRATVVGAPDGAVWLLREDAPGAELAACLDRSVFRDDVHIDDRSASLPVRLVAGVSGARARFGEGGAPARIHETEQLALAVGEMASTPPVTEIERIRLGRARHGSEITDEFTPYEVNLATWVHLDKGCYTGQEALQRLFTYGGVRRQLVRFEGEGAPPSPQEVRLGGAPVGSLTSAAAEGSAWAALAVVRLDAIEGGAPLSLADGRALPAPVALERSRALGRG